MSIEQGFLDALRETPGDAAALAAYHDWLIDAGRPADALALAGQNGRSVERLAGLVGCVLVEQDPCPGCGKKAYRFFGR